MFPHIENQLTARLLNECPIVWKQQKNGRHVATERTKLGRPITKICITDINLDIKRVLLLGATDSFSCMLGHPRRFHHWKWLGKVPSSMMARQSQQKFVLQTEHFIWLHPSSFWTSTPHLGHFFAYWFKYFSLSFISSAISSSYSEHVLPACAPEW